MSATGRSFYTQTVDAALAEIDRLPGRHLYFLDDHLFGNRRFASALFDGMRGMGRLWQAEGTVNAVFAPGLLEQAVACGLRSLFVGFETLNEANLIEQRKYQNLRGDYAVAIGRLNDLGVMINGSFVFGLDADDGTVFDRTVDWAVGHGIETAAFPVRSTGTGAPIASSTDGGSLLRGAAAHDTVFAGLRHLAYAAGWKKFEPAWDLLIRAKRTGMMLPVLETILSEFGTRPPRADRPGGGEPLARRSSERGKKLESSRNLGAR